MAQRKTPHRQPLKRPSGFWVKRDGRLFTLEVFLISGPITRKFAKKNPVVSRTIQMRGDDTLEDLHYAIFEAFGREDQHMYEFQVGGKGPMDRRARRYVIWDDYVEPLPNEPKPAGSTVTTTIGSLGLKVGDPFGYWFDFGDDWWHQISVAAIDEKANPRAKYPRVTKRVGRSPPQYIDWDKEDE